MSKFRHQPERDEVLWRGFGQSMSRDMVSLCVHLREELDEYLEDAITIGAMVKLTKDTAVRCAVDSMMPVDLSEDEKFRWAGQATKLFFWTRGSRKCATCGHIARGKLAQSSPEEKMRWKRRLAEGEA